MDVIYAEQIYHTLPLSAQRCLVQMEKTFGTVVKDSEGVLDLRNWSMCEQCGEPVDK